jgi:predicted TIM-barrel fold metal-dependent hydrolase
MINDAHCHFFSTPFFGALASQRGRSESVDDLCRELHWDAPGAAEDLAGRWVTDLDAGGVGRAAVIASMPGDEQSVAAAVALRPERFVGFFMVDASAEDAVERTRRGLTELGLRTVCLFPAMNHVPLYDDRVTRVVEIAAQVPGAAVFIHCGALSVGVRQKLGLPSRFHIRLGNPMEVSRLALAFPHVPFIIPHFGAGLFREALMAADLCPNIYFDTSSSNRWIRYTPGLTLAEAFRAAIGIAGPTRVLFGTDSSYFPRGWHRSIYEEQKAIVVGLHLGAADAALIFGGNFDRLFPNR